MAKQFFDYWDGYAAHCQMTCESMAKIMERSLYLEPLGQCCEMSIESIGSIERPEDVFAILFLFGELINYLNHFRCEGNASWSLALWRKTFIGPDTQPLIFEINITPPEICLTSDCHTHFMNTFSNLSTVFTANLANDYWHR